MRITGVQFDIHYRSAKIHINEQKHETPQLDYGMVPQSIDACLGADLQTVHIPSIVIHCRKFHRTFQGRWNLIKLVRVFSV